ncbi:MAG: ABC-type transport auxiliary lipoprotein family protein [Zoogloea sp.]|uniref:ABC-type transport auxiliary lipoprotein family protein n=1 Tax=Zoogloea sp. TaxID=49181 RepID=UPI002601EFB8|nr:ABC-type transport auxiliary lipoprotein family protein [Zoogloea sp.]MDD2987604.1 ABC-type transport auxiliary lipoprotein family protein [Zoogloea sp.]
MPRLLLLLLLSALGGCTALPPSTAGVAVHDFGPLEAATLIPVGLPLRNVEVVPAPWLASNVMAYRLVYAQSTRRQAFKDSRWAAQPAQLVELVLKRALRAGDPATPAGGCRLRVDLDEFTQRFDSPQLSRGVIEARVTLLAPRTEQPLAVRAFAVDHEAPTADAAGGVIALRAGALQLKSDIRSWLEGLDAAPPGVAGSLRIRCGS